MAASPPARDKIVQSYRKLLLACGKQPWFNGTSGGWYGSTGNPNEWRRKLQREVNVLVNERRRLAGSVASRPLIIRRQRVERDNETNEQSSPIIGL